MEKYGSEWIKQKHTELEQKTRIAKDGDLYSLSDVNKHLNEYSSDLGWAISEASMLEAQFREMDQVKSAWERQAFVRAKFLLKMGPKDITGVFSSSQVLWFNKKFGGLEPKPTQKDIDNFVCLRWPRQVNYYNNLTQGIELKLKVLEDYKKLWFKMDDIYKVIGSNIKFERDKMSVFEARSDPSPSVEGRIARVQALMNKDKGGSDGRQ